MTNLIGLRTTPLDRAEVEGAVADPSAGAIVSFVGAVRNHSDGRPVTRLEYEAYPEFAVKEMGRIVAELEREHPAVRFAVLHRIGALEVGDAAVICAASAAHRGEAFEACRRLIDEIKARVPIWKLEYGPEGPYWVGWKDARCDGHHEAETEAAHSHHSHHQPHGNGGERLRGSSRGVGGATIDVHCITVSDTRTLETDASGAVAERLLLEAGYQVTRHLVRDDTPAITEVVLECTRQQPTAILLTGGTGIGPRDVTYEAVIALLDKRIDGFGEQFRSQSIESVGTRALLSRAIAGTVGTVLVFAVPGSPRAVELALSRLVIPLLPHAASMLEGHGHG